MINNFNAIQQNFTAIFASYFSNISQLSTLPSLAQVSAPEISSIANEFANIASVGSVGQTFAVNQIAGFAAIPDFANAGWLGVDKETKTVKTPGGYEISIKNGTVSIKAPNGKVTTIKADPPGRTVKEVKTGKQTRVTSQVERVLRGDPVVKEADGDIWRYQGLGTFVLPDGTKIRINEVGEGKNLHINQIDIYNGNKHVAIKNKLVSADYKTVKTEVKRQFGQWRNVRTWRRWRGRALVRHTQQERTVTTTTIKHQKVVQKFDTEISDVRNDGFLHDALNADGRVFRLAGQGDAWSHMGREVLSGAGKGKDDKTKAFKLGRAIADSNVGRMGLILPYKLAYFQAIQAVQNQVFTMMNRFSFPAPQLFNPSPNLAHLAGGSYLSNWGVNSIFAGGFGGAMMFGSVYAQQNITPGQLLNQLFQPIQQLHTFFTAQFNLANSLGSGMFNPSIRG